MSFEQSKRRVSTTLVTHSKEWGVSVSEKQVRKFWLNAVLLVFSVLVMFSGLVIFTPILAGMYSSAEMSGIGHTILVVVSFFGVAAFINNQSRKGPRNALELDSNASELRIGFMNRYGVFVRQQVIPLARIEDAFVEYNAQCEPTLKFVVNGEQTQIALADAKPDRLNDVAARINEAASRALKAPRRSRIRSAIAGIGANYREMGNRAVSRIVSDT